ncbi:MAG: hypothetical protein CMH55_09190 [Myxococcales bacterium]|nr:hypothetical protein [Myxococcales bacterium]|tara:strand:+ start:210 stop:1688 length:1479 start_codon:yes stop_codon:yes gene_type:complete
MRKILVSSFIMGLLACQNTVEAPGIAVDGGLDLPPAADAGPTDLGPLFPSFDAGPPQPVPDAGSTDINDLPPAVFDAGFDEEEVPDDPPEEDYCGRACFGLPCAEECRFFCRFGLVGLQPEDREDYLRCIMDNSCEADSCLEEEPEVPQGCIDLCANRDLERCGVELGDSDQECHLYCRSVLAMMTSPARQAWLDCGVNQCSRRRPVNCDPASFFGPTPSQVCLDVANWRRTCEPNREESLWQDAYECESWRAPADQNNLSGGTHMVNCLREANCGAGGWYQCLVAAATAQGRRQAIVEACAAANECGGETGWNCQLFLTGFTRLMGERGISDLGTCIREAGEDCEAISTCLARNWQSIAAPNDVCRESCLACNDTSDFCLGECMRFRASLTHPQAEAYEGCLLARIRANSCEDVNPVGCIRAALPQVAATCNDYVEHLRDRCANARYYSDVMLNGWCAMGGVRTGLLTPENLRQCVDRTGCAVNTWEACSR